MLRYLHGWWPVWEILVRWSCTLPPGKPVREYCSWWLMPFLLSQPFPLLGRSLRSFPPPKPQAAQLFWFQYDCHQMLLQDLAPGLFEASSILPVGGGWHPQVLEWLRGSGSFAFLVSWVLFPSLPHALDGLSSRVTACKAHRTAHLLLLAATFAS